MNYNHCHDKLAGIPSIARDMTLLHEEVWPNVTLSYVQMQGLYLALFNHVWLHTPARKGGPPNLN